MYFRTNSVFGVRPNSRLQHRSGVTFRRDAPWSTRVPPSGCPGLLIAAFGSRRRHSTGNPNRYRLTLLSKISQSAFPGKIRKTAADLEILVDLYLKIIRVLEILAIGFEGAGYDAGNVHRSEMFRLQRRSNAERHLQAIDFVADLNHRLQDAMVDILLSVIQSFRRTMDRPPKKETSAIHVYQDSWRTVREHAG